MQKNTRTLGNLLTQNTNESVASTPNYNTSLEIFTRLLDRQYSNVSDYNNIDFDTIQSMVRFSITVGGIYDTVWEQECSHDVSSTTRRTA